MRGSRGSAFYQASWPQQNLCRRRQRKSSSAVLAFWSSVSVFIFQPALIFVQDRIPARQFDYMIRERPLSDGFKHNFFHSVRGKNSRGQRAKSRTFRHDFLSCPLSKYREIPISGVRRVIMSLFADDCLNEAWPATVEMLSSWCCMLDCWQPNVLKAAHMSLLGTPICSRPVGGASCERLLQLGTSSSE